MELAKESWIASSVQQLAGDVPGDSIADIGRKYQALVFDFRADERVASGHDAEPGTWEFQPVLEYRKPDLVERQHWAFDVSAVRDAEPPRARCTRHSCRQLFCVAGRQALRVRWRSMAKGLPTALLRNLHNEVGQKNRARTQVGNAERHRVGGLRSGMRPPGE